MGDADRVRRSDMDSAGWRAKAKPGHPFVVGAAGVLLAVGMWHALLWGFRQSPEPVETGWALVREMALPGSLRHETPAVGRASGQPAARSAPKSSDRKLSDRKLKVSPFRQSHPWAAPTGQRLYYPSSCPRTLRMPDLLFFRSEAEARASGFVPARDPACR